MFLWSSFAVFLGERMVWAVGKFSGGASEENKRDSDSSESGDVASDDIPLKTQKGGSVAPIFQGIRPASSKSVTCRVFKDMWP